MQLVPNQTLIEASVLSIEPDAEGWGKSLTLKVLRNVSDQTKDFIQPEEGQNLTLFSSSLHCPSVGEKVLVKATLLGGPRGERAVLQDISKLLSGKSS